MELRGSATVLILSKAVFARALGVDETKVRRRVLGPLGEEAAAASFGQYILTRHRAIAEAALDILVNKFHFDAEDVLVDLVRAAVGLAAEGVLVPDIAQWRFLSTRMFDKGNHELGVRLAAAALSADPRNSFLAVKLSQLHREAGQPDQSVEVFRSSIHRAQGNRAFFTEWATSEGRIGNAAVSVWLKAVSIADGTEMRPPDVKDTYLGLVGCAISFNTLFERYRQPTFLFAAIASAKLCLNMPSLSETTQNMLVQELEKSRRFDEAATRVPANHMQLFEQGVQLAYEQREVELPPIIPVPQKLTFAALKRFTKVLS